MLPGQRGVRVAACAILPPEITDLAVSLSEDREVVLTWTNGTDQRHLVVMGKGRKERMLPISAPTLQAIWRYTAARDDMPADAPLFATQGGGPLDRQQLRHLLDRLGRRAAIPDVHPHRFRHTFAITFLRNGGDIYSLQKLLGHTTLDMVKRYLSIAQADVEAAHRNASPVANWKL